MEARPPRAPKRFARGTERTADPAETFERVRPHLAQMGITRVADVTGLDRIGVPVAMAHRPNSRSLSVSPGKGLDLAAARTSAAMEALELWHAEHVVNPLRLATLSEIAAERHVIDVARLPRVLGRPFDAHLPILWIEGADLLTGGDVWIPYEAVQMSFALPLPPSSGALLASSNGLASGNHPLEALAHAVCELVERDAMSLWQPRDGAYRGARRVDPATIDDHDCRAVLARFERAGVAVAIWDITSDAGIATFACEIVDTDPGPGRPFLPGTGSGTHPRRAIALLRALTEAAQTRLTMIAGARDDVRVAQYIRALDDREQAAALERVRGAAPRSFGEAPDAAHASFDEDVVWLLGRLSSIGVRQVVAVDLSRPGIQVSVMRVLAPGLEGAHDAAGASPGARRLAAMGRTP